MDKFDQLKRCAWWAFMCVRLLLRDESPVARAFGALPRPIPEEPPRPAAQLQPSDAAAQRDPSPTLQTHPSHR